MRYIDVCSGISAPTMAWKPLGWEALCFAEIEPAPRAVLAHHYPNIPLRGDFTEIEGTEYGPVDLLVGGTPCQDNSVGYAAGAGEAGAGFSGSRGRLAYDFADLAGRSGARWFVWENVPNILNKRLAPGFERLVGRFVELGFGCAWRVLDARGFHLTDQPRERLFLVGCRGDSASAGAVLFEPEGPEWDTVARPEAAPVLTARGGMALDDRTPTVLDGGRPRIATPREWERAMGFPDDFTLVPHRGKPMADGPRYRMLGNSMAVPVLAWLGRRIQQVEGICSSAQVAA